MNRSAPWQTSPTTIPEQARTEARLPEEARDDAQVSHVDAEPALTDGFHLVLDALKLNGIKTIYGVPGIPVTDLGRLAQEQGFRVISFRHEQNAGHAAGVAGFLTQMPGICLTVSAPGFLNGLTALANANTNCFPMILISGSSGARDRGPAAGRLRGDGPARHRQAPVQGGVSACCTPPTSASAWPAPYAPPCPGGQAACTWTCPPSCSRRSWMRMPAHARWSRSLTQQPAQHPAPEAIARALDLLRSAKRPLIILGKGAAYAQADDAIRTLVERTGIPYVPMSMAKGLLPDTHEQSAGAARSTVLKDSDVVLMIGARLNWLLSHGKGKAWGEPGATKFIQVDIEPREMDSNVEIAAPVVGDIKSVVAALLNAIGPDWPKPPADWINAVRKRRDANIAKMAPKLMNNTSPMNFHGALGALRKVVADHPDIMLVNEGANTLDLARGIIDMFGPRQRLDVGTWGNMGIGMGSAIAAAVETGKPVLCIEGDSAFGFCGMEVETICRYKPADLRGGVQQQRHLPRHGREPRRRRGRGNHRVRARCPLRPHDGGLWRGRRVRHQPRRAEARRRSGARVWQAHPHQRRH